MVNTTDQYWEVNGVSLQTLARNIQTLAGRITPAPLRGSDTVIPSTPGEKWEPKVAGSRVITLSMWILGSDDDGNAPSGHDARRDKFDSNWDDLVDLLWTPGRQIQLKKRFKFNGVDRSATALAEFVGGLEPTMMGRYGAKFQVDLKLADPFFYDDVETSVALPTGNLDVDVITRADTNYILFTIQGDRGEATIRNNTLGIEVQYNQDVLVGDSVEIDVKKYNTLVIDADNPGGYSANGRIIHEGSPQWMWLRRGINQINVNATGTGVVTMKYRGAFH